MSARYSRGGFTLLELVAVMIIISITTVIAVPAFRSLIVEDDITTATHRIEALFKVARDSALRGGLPVTVVIDSVSGSVWLDSPVPPPLDDTLSVEQRRRNARTIGKYTSLTSADSTGESLELPRGVSLELTRARATFVFAPSGATFADSLVLRTPLTTRLLTVDRWTGDVIVY
jgi:prepilin-type N-terminal cleavage/methylation domain-containing protein